MAGGDNKPTKAGRSTGVGKSTEIIPYPNTNAVTTDNNGMFTITGHKLNG